MWESGGGFTHFLLGTGLRLSGQLHALATLSMGKVPPVLH